MTVWHIHSTSMYHPYYKGKFYDGVFSNLAIAAAKRFVEIVWTAILEGTRGLTGTRSFASRPCVPAWCVYDCRVCSVNRCIRKMWPFV